MGLPRGVPGAREIERCHGGILLGHILCHLPPVLPPKVHLSPGMKWQLFKNSVAWKN